MSDSIARPGIPYAAIAAAMAMGLLGVTYLVDPPEEDALRQFLVTAGVIAVATAIVFGLVVPHRLGRGGSGRAALTLSILGLMLVPAYWLGLSPILAVGGIVLGRDSEVGESGPGRAAVAVGLVALLAAVGLPLADAALG